MKTSPLLQKLSVTISLVILALGFSLIGLTSVLHSQSSGNALEFGNTICALGGWVGVAAGGSFFVAALLYLQRSFRLIA
jgi:hypothetical protein